MHFFGVLIFSVLLLLSLFCSQTRKEGYKMETENSLNPVKLEGEVKQKDDSLVIDYQLTNQSQQPIYVWDLMIGYSGDEEVINHELAYLCLEEPNTLRVARAVLKLPFDRDVYMMEIPYVRAVAPNEMITGKIVLPVPVEEYNPYYPPTEPENYREVEANKIRLLIGWTEARAGMIISDTTVGGEEVKMIRGAWEGAFQHLAERTFRAQVKMKVRTDAFDRQMPKQ